MALPTIAVVNTAINAIYNVAAETKTLPGGRKVVSDLGRTFEYIRQRYAPLVSVDLTDATDAGVAEAIAADGEVGLAYAAVAGTGASFPVGGVFKIAGTTEDFTDNALATAKGSAVAANDLFQVSGADAVTYLGNSGTPILTSDNEWADFVSLGA